MWRKERYGREDRSDGRDGIQNPKGHSIAVDAHYAHFWEEMKTGKQSQRGKVE